MKAPAAVRDHLDMIPKPTEMHNLSKDKPEKTSELAKTWDAWSKDCKTKPR